MALKKKLSWFSIVWRINRLKNYQKALDNFVETRSRGLDTSTYRLSLTQDLDLVKGYLKDAGINRNCHGAPNVFGGDAPYRLPDDTIHFAEGETNTQPFHDVFQVALGVYKREKIPSILRTLNPLFWAGALIRWLFEVPIFIAVVMGFEEKSTRNNPVMRIVLFAWRTLTAIGLLVSIVSGAITIVYDLRSENSFILNELIPELTATFAEDQSSGTPNEN